jgi:hypothetical protein
MNAINFLCVAVAMLAIVCLMLLRIVGRLELHLNMINDAREKQAHELQRAFDHLHISSKDLESVTGLENKIIKFKITNLERRLNETHRFV